jgi:hypothetical protein
MTSSAGVSGNRDRPPGGGSHRALVGPAHGAAAGSRRRHRRTRWIRALSRRPRRRPADRGGRSMTARPVAGCRLERRDRLERGTGVVLQRRRGGRPTAEACRRRAGRRPCSTARVDRGGRRRARAVRAQLDQVRIRSVLALESARRRRTTARSDAAGCSDRIHDGPAARGAAEERCAVEDGPDQVGEQNVVLPALLRGAVELGQSRRPGPARRRSTCGCSAGTVANSSRAVGKCIPAVGTSPSPE